MISKDWKGNSNSVFKIIGASSHCDDERHPEDFYATDPIAIDLLCSVEKFEGTVWEPCCGQGHLSERLKNFGYTVFPSDIIDRGYGKSGVDFLKQISTFGCNNIITNPPYSFAQEFVTHSLFLLPENGKLAMFLKLTFLEAKKRKELFEKFPPKTVYVSSSRIICAKNGDFDKQKKIGSAVAYCWYLWEKGYKGETVIKWIN